MFVTSWVKIFCLVFIMPGANIVQKKAGLFSLKMRLEDMLLDGVLFFFTRQNIEAVSPPVQYLISMAFDRNFL